MKTEKKATKFNKKSLLNWVNKFTHVPILVVGDLMLDRSIHGSVDRISPEAPVPVISVNKDSKTAGGAGNVVYNLAELGALPTLVSVRGDDIYGEDIVHDFRSRSINDRGLVIDPDRPTIRKIRILAGQQQIARVDFEKKENLSSQIQKRIISTIKTHLPDSRGVVISDYGKGVVSPKVIQQLLKDCHRQKKSVTVDPKIENFMQYKGVDCITPNAKEAVEGMRVLPPKDEKGFYDLGKKITTRLRCQSLLITRGEKGILLFRRKGKVVNIPTQAREVFDVTGAGDTVVAAFTLARAVGAPHEQAAQIANIAAGIVVGKLGTACASQKELISAIKRYRG